jgi:hypothetical protein
MMEFVLFIAAVVAFPALLFGLLQLITPQSPIRASVAIQIGRHHYRLWQLVVAVALCALLFSTATVPAPIVPLTLAALLLLGLFLRAWQSEFVFLMGLRDDDFPGRYDKLIWVLVLLAFAPIGPWFFRSYRLAHWPAPGPAHESQTQFHAEPPSPTTTAAQPA